MAKGFTIAVASGKGGTGKTTVAVNLAWLAAQSGQPVQYLDCDVEEPNGHIFLKPRIDESIDVNANVPTVDPAKCTGCGKCAEVCQYNAIVCLGKANVLTFEQLCHSCGGCMRLCPEKAITAKPLNIGHIECGASGPIDFFAGCLNIGSIRTTLLIDSVKQHIAADRLNILDVPPGTSCPVVASLKRTDFLLLVTEPTPFGLNDLTLAVDLAGKMALPFAVVINRAGLGNSGVEDYCHAENIQIAAQIPDDRRIAEAYSVGGILLEKLPEYRKHFDSLLSFVTNKLNTSIEARQK